MATEEWKERKILVAIDEGEESMYALSWCLKYLISSNYKDTLVLLYVKPPQVVYSGANGSGYLFNAEVLMALEKHVDFIATSVMERAKTVLKDYNEVKVEMMVEKGDPRDVICAIASRIRADILILGTHGYGLIKRAILGSVSSHCAHHAKCPVMIVKSPKQ